jgi:ATP-dependent helicase HrpA
MTGPGPEPDLRRFILDQTRTLDRERLLARLDAGDDPAMVQRDAAASAAEVRRRRAALPRPRFDQALPILARRDEIAEAIREHAVVVVCGETGSGKTTQLPQMCLDLGRGAAGMIAHTQPRRIAARAVASRIAEELAVPLGGTVGVKVRFDDRTSPATAIKIMTDGMLLAETQQDPGLWAYDTVIIDEAHERSLNIDFLLGYLRTLRSTRPDLRVIITSATIDPARFAAFFAGPRGPAPVLNVSGRTYPVEVRYRPALSRDDDTPEVSPDAVARAVEELSGPALPPGDILAFLPGEREIRQCADALARARGGWEVLPLYARLSAPEQDRVFHPTPGVRRVILSTNVAETSLTVPGIRYVVDTGLVRLARYDPKARVQRLPIELVSRASADQRSGRCGRQAAGVAIRLYDRRDLDAAPAFTEPEVLRSDLAGVLLQMLALRLGPIESFPFLDAPEAGAVADARLTLFELGAVDGPGPEGRLTPLGERLARLPLEPRVGRMLLAAQVEGALEEVIVLASFFSIQDPRERPLSAADRADLAREVFRDPDSDFMSLLKLWDQYRHAAERGSRGELAAWCREHFLSPARMREWSDVARQLKDAAEELDLRPASGPASPEAIHRALLTGLIANVCCRDEGLGQHEYRGFRGNVVSLFPGSVLFKKNPRWIVAAEIVQTTRLYARTLARIDPAWVEELAGHVMQRQLTDRHYDKQTHAACVWERVSMAGIVVVPRRKVPLAPLDPAAARGVFIRDGLASGALDGIPFAEHNRAVLARAADLEARLRRRGLCRSPDNLADWFDARLPPEVVDAASLRAWLTPERDAALRLDERDVLRPDALFAADPALFPDSLTLAGDTCPVVYRFEPGHDDDGVTVTVPLRALPDLTPDRAEWLVPGLLADKVLAALKALPKPDRARVEAAGDPRALSADLAGVLEFGVGPLGAAMPPRCSAVLRCPRCRGPSPPSPSTCACGCES